MTIPEQDKADLRKQIKCYLHPLENYDSILDLINLIQPHVPWSKAYFEWQMLRNPAGKARIWVGEYAGHVIAAYAAIPHHVKSRHAEGIGWRVQDVMTHPDFRGLGLMHDLAVACRESICQNEFPVNFTFPNDRSHNSFIRLGWSKAFRVPLSILDDLHHIPEMNYNGLKSITPITEFESQINTLWDKSKGIFPFAISRYVDYLTWRYLQRPGTEYFPFVFTEEGQVQGLMVLKYYDASDQERITHICDLFTIPGKEYIVNKLIMKAVQFSLESGASQLTAWLPPGNAYDHLYYSIGFKLNETIDRWFLVWPQDGMSETVGAEKSENWQLTMGDSDVY